MSENESECNKKQRMQDSQSESFRQELQQSQSESFRQELQQSRVNLDISIKNDNLSSHSRWSNSSLIGLDNSLCARDSPSLRQQSRITNPSTVDKEGTLTRQESLSNECLLKNQQRKTNKESHQAKLQYTHMQHSQSGSFTQSRFLPQNQICLKFTLPQFHHLLTIILSLINQSLTQNSSYSTVSPLQILLKAQQKLKALRYPPLTEPALLDKSISLMKNNQSQQHSSNSFQSKQSLKQPPKQSLKQPPKQSPQSTMQIISQQYMIIKCLIQQFLQIHKSPNSKLQKLQHFQPFTPQSILDAQKIFPFIELWNKKINSSNKFNLSYFAKFLNISQDLSKKQIKIQVFTIAYLCPKLGNRILKPILTTQLIQKLGYNKLLTPITQQAPQQQAPQQQVPQQQAPYQQVPQQQKQKMTQKDFQNNLNYIIHLSQYFNQILSQYSSSANITLSSSFNCARFLLMNLMCFFMLQLFKYIEMQIQQKYGQNNFVTFKQYLGKNKRWNDCQSKILECIKLSSQKINIYILEAKDLKKLKDKPVNVKKVRIIFESNPNLKKLYNELNLPSQKPQSTQKRNEIVQKYLNNFYPDKTKQIYYEAIQIMLKQCCNKIIFERTINNKIAKKEQYQQFFVDHKIALQSFDKIQSITPKNMQEKQILLKILQEYTTIHLENLKCFCLIMALPFYSFQNQHQNLRRRKYLQQRAKNPNKIHTQISQRFFPNIDRLYIYKRDRFNYEYLATRHESVVQKIYEEYMKMTNQLIVFIEKDGLREKENLLNSLLLKLPNVLKDEKLLHENRMAIFDVNKCKQIVYITHQHIKNPSADRQTVEKQWVNRLKKEQVNLKFPQPKTQKIYNKKQPKTSTDMQSYLYYISNFQQNMIKIINLYKRIKEEINEANEKKQKQKRIKQEEEKKKFMKNKTNPIQKQNDSQLNIIKEQSSNSITNQQQIFKTSYQQAKILQDLNKHSQSMDSC